MKRETNSKSQTSPVKTRALDVCRLTAVRGGAGLGITVEVVTPPPPIMTQQHNETLMQL